MKYTDIIDKLKAQALNPAKTINETVKSTGKDPFGCFPIYTPEEVVYAAGYIPVGIWGGRTDMKYVDRYLQSFCCSIMRSNMEQALKGTYNMLKGVIIPTFCDTLKCICENWKVAVPQIPLIAMSYPQNRSIEAGVRFAEDEFRRVRDELEMLSSRNIADDDVEKAFELYEEYRGAMREFTEAASKHQDKVSALDRHLVIKAGYFRDKNDYMEDIRQITAGLAEEPETAPEGTSVVVTGLMAEPGEILEMFDTENITIAADDLAQESRQFRTPASKEGDVWRRMAMRVSNQRGDTFLYEENKSRGKMLIDMVRETGAEGVVVFLMKFCDPEEFDYPIYKAELEKAGVPLLYLETDLNMDSYEQIRTRIQSFSEMLL